MFIPGHHLLLLVGGVSTAAYWMDGSGQEVQSVVFEVLIHQRQDDLLATWHKWLNVLVCLIAFFPRRQMLNFGVSKVQQIWERFTPFRKTWSAAREESSLLLVLRPRLFNWKTMWKTVTHLYLDGKACSFALQTAHSKWNKFTRTIAKLTKAPIEWK